MTNVGSLDLAGLATVKIENVVDDLKRDTDFFAELTKWLTELGWRVRGHDADHRTGRDERTGLVGENLEIMLDGVDTVGGTCCFVQLTEAQAFES